MFGQKSDTKVIALDSRRSGFARPDCFSALDAYWDTLAQGRIMPSRDDVDPRGLTETLDTVFLLERIAPGLAKFRLAGQRVGDLMGMDLRGMPLSSLFTPAARDALSDALQAVFDEPARLELVLQGQRHGLRGRIAAQLLILPLRDRDGNVTRAIGTLSIGGAQFKAPQRFDIVGENRRTLVGYGTRPTPAIDEDALFEAADATRRSARHRRDMRVKLTVISGTE